MNNDDKGMILADLRIAGMLCSCNRFDRLLASFHIQQAIEKTIKFKANDNGLTLYGHDIKILITDCDMAGIDIGIPKLIRKNADMYTSWYNNRYNINAFVKVVSINSACSAVMEWLHIEEIK